MTETQIERAKRIFANMDPDRKARYLEIRRMAVKEIMGRTEWSKTLRHAKINELYPEQK